MNPQEITLQFCKTKADQVAFATCKTMLRTGQEFVCVVESMQQFKEVAPPRFGNGPERHLPLSRWAPGPMLKRLEVQNILQKSAKALRIGEASALDQATGEVELVKRTGRWSSSAVQRYLHDSGDVLARPRWINTCSTRSKLCWLGGKVA